VATGFLTGEARAGTGAERRQEGPAAMPKRWPSVRAVLAAHRWAIFVLPSNRRIAVEMLLEHLAEAGSDGEWADAECEVHFAEKIDPWAAPSSAPCWEGMQGPLFHLWSVGLAGEPRKLIGLIIGDQRAEVVEELVPEEAEASEPAAPDAEAAGGEIELSHLIVEGEYHPCMAETDPAIRALTPPAGDGWQGRWWKLGSRGLWQYGWWRRQ
jgi:hypothetical protein